MRSLLIAFSAAALVSPALADEKCTGEVSAAFAKQSAAPRMRTVMVHPSHEGEVTRTINLVRPNRMHAITDAPDQIAGHVETISIGQWAWGSDSDGAWAEHKPNVAKMIEMDVERMAAQQTVGANFTCLGKVAFEGKDYAGYRADPGKGDDGIELAATVYVDEATGLPAWNIVAPTSGEGPVRLKAAYSYGDDITVEPPPGYVEPVATAKEGEPPSAAPPEAAKKD